MQIVKLEHIPNPDDGWNNGFIHITERSYSLVCTRDSERQVAVFTINAFSNRPGLFLYNSHLYSEASILLYKINHD